ncbi:hypothetical protein L1049_000190 [Liquidambar formosana]|uniref:VOC domain-containing protein n=1 Tax=Liquidambar formosana TaxID=63359 RepID=A0AAP0R4M8_LIQFO
MATSAEVASSNDTLEWVQKDNRRFLHAIYRVIDLDRTIKYAILILVIILFYTQHFGMQLLRRSDVPKANFSNAVLGFGPEESHFVLELIYNHGVDKLDFGTAFGHFGIAAEDVYKIVEDIRASGGVITREPGPAEGGGSTIYAFVQDPNGYSFELVQRDAPIREPLCQALFNVVDLDRSIEFYQKALGMNLLLRYANPREQFDIGMVGYGDDLNQTTVIELRYNYNVTEYTQGNAYSQVVISTDDVYKSAEAVKLVTQELGGKIIRPPGPIPGTDTKITSFLDLDGFKTVLMDNEDFLKELQKKE